MELSSDACYRAFESRDPRFDGHFFVGVTSTKIYCRPICTAKTPKRENCDFFDTTAAAEAVGFRPCLLCRPELAPGRSRLDSGDRLAARALRRVESGALVEGTASGLATELGISDRHLRRVLADRYGVSLIELAQTQRLLTAKRLLTDSRMAVGEIALASGFSSLRRFNTLFKERYRMKPTEVRNSGAPRAPHQSLGFSIPFRPPFDWHAMLRFLELRAIEGVENIVGTTYVRAVRIATTSGYVTVVRDGERSLSVTLSDDLSVQAPRILRRLGFLFDSSAEPDAVAATLGLLAECRPGLRVPGCFDPFEMATSAILGQQITVKAARTLASRIVSKFGEDLESAHPFGYVSRTFPTAAVLADAAPEALGLLGITRTRVEAIRRLAALVAEKHLVLVPGADPEQIVGRLQELPGIGPWTAQYIAMRALNWPDAFLPGDFGVRKALGGVTPTEATRMAEPWRPWRSYAVLHLWNSLGD